MQEYYQKHKERLCANSRAYYAENSIKIREKLKEQRQETAAKNKSYYQLHKEEIKAKQQKRNKPAPLLGGFIVGINPVLEFDF